MSFQEITFGFGVSVGFVDNYFFQKKPQTLLQHTRVFRCVYNFGVELMMF